MEYPLFTEEERLALADVVKALWTARETLEEQGVDAQEAARQARRLVETARQRLHDIALPKATIDPKPLS